MPILRLAIPTPLRRLFDYLPPPDLDETQLANLKPGVRVSAPFGARQVCGVLVEVAAQSDLAPDKLRPARAVLDAAPPVSPHIQQLCLWAADYYKAPPGEVFAAALPGLRKGSIPKPPTQKHWRLNVNGQGLPTGALKRAKRQAELLEMLQQAGEAGLSAEALKERGVPTAVRRELQKKGLVECIEREVGLGAENPHIGPHSHPHNDLQTNPQNSTHTNPNIAPNTGPHNNAHIDTNTTPHPGPTLNPEQAAAVTHLCEKLDEFRCHLLQGVTGSGKTEVYLRVIEQVLAAGRQALVLVPEIGLTPQTLRRFEARFNTAVAVLHSALPDSERNRAWDLARRGAARIVIGTRSAVFTPLARPGLIVVDEEHDSSYKQQDGFRYSARDLAVKRAQLEGTPVILGSATPALESLHNAGAGRYHHLSLSQRAGGGTLPTFQLLDVRGSQLRAGMSDPLLQAVAAELQAGNQVLLFLNRRGFAPVLQCHDCGHVAECRDCDARLTVHLHANELRCHHCDRRQALPRQCPQCNSRRLTALGVGTEQTESALAQLFPDTPTHRVDRDSMGKRGAMERLIDSLASGGPAILLGTQMLTKGHHFPGVTLAGLLDMDAGLFSADFRGPERIGQLLVQVGGRAGRADKPGRVIIQTHYPDHPLLATLIGRGYNEYAQLLLEQRRQVGMPPFGHLLLLRVEGRTLDAAQQCLEQVRHAATPDVPAQARLVGPLPAPMQRRGGRFRAQLLGLCQSRSGAQATAEALVRAAEELPSAKRLRWSLDVDPQDTF